MCKRRKSRSNITAVFNVKLKQFVIVMARHKNDGRGRMGGRAKGTPNKTTVTIKGWITSLVDNNREQVEADLAQLEPKDRLMFFEKLLQYVAPKQQAVSAEVSVKENDAPSMTEEEVKAELERLRKLRENE